MTTMASWRWFRRFERWWCRCVPTLNLSALTPWTTSTWSSQCAPCLRPRGQRLLSWQFLTATLMVQMTIREYRCSATKQCHCGHHQHHHCHHLQSSDSRIHPPQRHARGWSSTQERRQHQSPLRGHWRSASRWWRSRMLWQTLILQLLPRLAGIPHVRCFVRRRMCVDLWRRRPRRPLQQV